MAVLIIFFTSLGGIVLLLGFKIFELNHGIKAFSASRYKIDTAFQKKIELFLSYRRYVTWPTLRLLGQFFLLELKAGFSFIARVIGQTKIGSMVKGKDTPDGNGNGGGTNSEFLKSIPSFKEENKDSSN